MPGIVTARTRSLYLRPPAPPYTLNRDCPSARGIVAWWPLGEANPRTYGDWAGGRVLTQNGTMTVEAGPDGGYATGNTANAANYLELATAVLTAYPATFEAWAYLANVTAAHNLLFISQGASNYLGLTADGSAAGDPVKAVVGATGENSSTTTTAYAANTWFHACAVFTSGTLRASYLNGGGKGTNATSRTPTLTGTNRTTVGAFNSGASRFSPVGGRVAHAAIRNVALTDAEVGRLYDPATRWELYYPLGRKTYSFPAEGGGAETYTATAALTAGSATLAATATFAAPTYTATAALSAGGATLAAAATHTTPTYTATAAFTKAAPTLAATATFAAPVYTATAAFTKAAPTLAATASFTAPVYTATAALSAGGATLAATGIFATAVYQATAAFTKASATLAATATFAAPVYTASAALAPGGATLAASATFDVPVYTATAALAAGPASLAASATFTGVAVATDLGATVYGAYAAEYGREAGPVGDGVRVYGQGLEYGRD